MIEHSNPFKRDSRFKHPFKKDGEIHSELKLRNPKSKAVRNAYEKILSSSPVSPPEEDPAFHTPPRDYASFKFTKFIG